MKAGRRAGGRAGRGALVWATVACCLTAALPHRLAAQRRCQIEVENVDRQGVQVTVTETVSNYFAGGNVRVKCRGQNVRIWADSIASYQGSVVQFIGNFRYEDDETKVTSDFGTYYRDDERWEARNNVTYLDRRDGSTLKGPMVNYYRKIRGTREYEEAYAEQRPTLTIAAQDTAGRPGEPYRVIADRVRTRGQDVMWAGGTVQIDRSDLKGRSDSLWLDTGKTGSGSLLGHASIERAAEDSFALTGKRIDLKLVEKQLTGVNGRDSATLRSRDLDLAADQIGLQLEKNRVTQTLAWGKTSRPEALADDYQVKGDSLAVDTPDEALKELRAFGKAWVGFRPDTAQGERDWLSGERIVAKFEPKPGAATKKSELRTLEAREGARSFYRITNPNTPGALPSLNYSRADRILLTMQPGDSLKVQRVDMAGKVDGIQLEAQPARADTTKPRRP